MGIGKSFWKKIWNIEEKSSLEKDKQVKNENEASQEEVVKWIKGWGLKSGILENPISLGTYRDEIRMYIETRTEQGNKRILKTM